MHIGTVNDDSVTPVADLVNEFDGPVVAMDLSPTGDLLAVECRGEIQLLDPRTLDTLCRWRADETKVRRIAFHPDGASLVTAGHDGAVTLWDTASGMRIRTLTRHDGRSWSVSFSSDASMVASVGNDRSVRVCRTEGPQHRVLDGHDAPIRAVALAPDGARIASGDEAHRIAIWDVASGQLERWLPGHTGKVRCLGFRPDGALVSGSSDGTVRLWDIDTGAQLRLLQAHGTGRTGKIRTLAFSPGHEVMVTGSQDHTARVWVGQRWSPHKTLRGHHDVVTASAVSQRYRRAFTAAADHTLRSWALD